MWTAKKRNAVAVPARVTGASVTPRAASQDAGFERSRGIAIVLRDTQCGLTDCGSPVAAAHGRFYSALAPIRSEHHYSQGAQPSQHHRQPPPPCVWWITLVARLTSLDEPHQCGVPVKATITVYGHCFGLANRVEYPGGGSLANQEERTTTSQPGGRVKIRGPDGRDRRIEAACPLEERGEVLAKLSIGMHRRMRELAPIQLRHGPVIVIAAESTAWVRRNRDTT